MSLSFSVWLVSLFTLKEIFSSTEEPSISPLSSAFCIWGKLTVILTAFFPVGKSLETAVALVHITLLKLVKGLCDCCIPEIWLWLASPKRGTNVTFWKLNLSASGVV